MMELDEDFFGISWIKEELYKKNSSQLDRERLRKDIMKILSGTVVDKNGKHIEFSEGKVFLDNREICDYSGPNGRFTIQSADALYICIFDPDSKDITSQQVYNMDVRLRESADQIIQSNEFEKRCNCITHILNEEICSKNKKIRLLIFCLNKSFVKLNQGKGLGIWKESTKDYNISPLVNKFKKNDLNKEYEGLVVLYDSDLEEKK